jgi:hypothetical protein
VAQSEQVALKKILYTELARSSNGYFKPLLDPGAGLTVVSEVKRTLHNRFGSETVTNL